MNEDLFEYKGKVFYAEEIPKEVYKNLGYNVCYGCYFNEDSLSNECANIPCFNDEREDGREVIFKELKRTDKTICPQCDGGRFCVLRYEDTKEKIYMWVCSECGNREEEVVEK